jgi:biopolymer transport protein ExbB
MGRSELEDRLQGGRVDADGALLPQSLAAIRASVNAVFVKETQRLNGLMVILTIAIAGGPFIGLLGTVIGVMITFASIVAAGDVNVNAIAPGISAALLATVAGLAVAIPALFGYNYFTVRIREISAEMQIFLEELITRIAEGVRVRGLRQPAE